MAKLAGAVTLLLVLAVFGLAATQAEASSRSLLAATDNRFNFYRQQCVGQNVMVCKRCTAAGVMNANPNGSQDGGFLIWCLDSGVITRQGDGGTDNWQFSGCFNRAGNQGSEVTFTKPRPDGTC